ncbi:phage virion morphogenesis protein [Nissabacter sp. SGAir0207]|uniref:phage virion morphogenesis protein n=1 Tax=Nissabacter sp. SGAir0207 TaxID=2126321 RepID=UPI0010CD6794|nr:phage virion morphogenesis protein [Nissabacter sp. SGAir0207]QCR37047.1 phage virion morphogenesis protein [Nissabacter sp. SGAir0207]
MSELRPFEARLAALIANLSPEARKELAKGIARRLRAGQQQNIKRQQAPDGTPFAPRKPAPPSQARTKKGRVKREMFAKLRTAKYLKAKANVNEAVVEFTGNVQRLARVHHYGLRDRPSRHGGAVRYEARPLLGINEAEQLLIEQEVIAHLAG